jgi:plastin-1
MHTINEDERASFTAHINSDLALDPDVQGRIPMKVESMQLFSECRGRGGRGNVRVRVWCSLWLQVPIHHASHTLTNTPTNTIHADGILLAKLINRSVPNTIDERVLNLPKAGKALNTFMMTENNNLVINSAKAIGCSVVNIGAQDLLEGREHLLLGLIWQIIKIGLTSKISITLHPEIFRLLERDEELETLLSQSAEYVLLRWFNHHLEQANAPRRVANFSVDLKDGEAYTYLLNQLCPKQCPRAPLLMTSTAERVDHVGRRFTVLPWSSAPLLQPAVIRRLLMYIPYHIPHHISQTSPPPPPHCRCCKMPRKSGAAST